MSELEAQKTSRLVPHSFPNVSNLIGSLEAWTGEVERTRAAAETMR